MRHIEQCRTVWFSCATGAITVLLPEDYKRLQFVETRTYQHITDPSVLVSNAALNPIRIVGLSLSAISRICRIRFIVICMRFESSRIVTLWTRINRRRAAPSSMPLWSSVNRLMAEA